MTKKEKAPVYAPFSDITERKRVEDQLRVSEERYRSLTDDVLDSSGVGIIILDRDFRVVWVNQALERYLGLRRDEVIGKDERVLIRQRIKHIFEDPEGFANKLLSAYDEGSFIKNFECHALPSGGREERWLEYWSLPIRSGLYAGGRIEHCYDITKRRRAEEEQESLLSAYGEQNQIIATYNTELEATLARAKQVETELRELYQREKELRRELETEIKKRAEFSRALVHELKTPLTPMLASSEMLVDELQEEPWLGLARNIHRGALSLNNRIDELLDVARGELGMLEVNLKSVDLLSLLRKMADDMTSMASRREQSLILELPPSLPMVRADESRLWQVLLNLIGNASKFTPEGGKITLRAREKAGSIVVEVQDTGPGIAKENQERLFESYYQIKTEGQRSKGLGLGLALCKKLIELHKGQIWVESQVGKGSTFGFSVPLATDQPAKKRKKKRKL